MLLHCALHNSVLVELLSIQGSDKFSIVLVPGTVCVYASVLLQVQVGGTRNGYQVPG
jgi:hypothetical protein